MIFDFTISIQLILTFIGFAVTLVWNFFHMKARTDRAEEKADHAKEVAIAAAAKADALEKQMLREYASMETMQKVEDRLSASIGTLTSEIRELRAFLMDKSKG